MGVSLAKYRAERSFLVRGSFMVDVVRDFAVGDQTSWFRTFVLREVEHAELMVLQNLRSDRTFCPITLMA